MTSIADGTGTKLQSTLISGQTATQVPETNPNAKKLVWVMAAACGLSVANLYYNQPLLADMAREFHVSARKAGAIPTMTQIGYATGLLFLVPLGDIRQRRRLVVTLLTFVTFALIAAALARNLLWMSVASLAIGTFTVVPQVLIPFVAQLTPPAQRGRAIGIVMCGLLIGVLLSRTVSGYVGQHLGWRAMYWIAAGLMVLLAAGLWPMVPHHELKPHVPYRKLLTSVLDLLRQYPVLRQAAVNGGLVFGAFSAFWATLVFHLETPTFHYGSREAGLFGVVGLVGALAAPIVGRVADRRGPRSILTFAAALMFVSYLAFWALGSSIIGMGIAVIALDLAMQTAQVSNQTRIYGLPGAVHSRVNTAYMGSFFVGGACGSIVGAWGWSVGHWPGVCLVGAAFSGAALVLHVMSKRSFQAAS